MTLKEFLWCGEGDLNSHALAGAATSRLCVCQFRHFRSSAEHDALASCHLKPNASVSRGIPEGQKNYIEAWRYGWPASLRLSRPHHLDLLLPTSPGFLTLPRRSPEHLGAGPSFIAEGLMVAAKPARPKVCWLVKNTALD
jgi:hypothetical protein